MKLVKILEIASVAGIAAFGISAAFGTHTAETAAIATIPFVLACFLRDYSPRTSRWEPTRSPVRFTAVRRPVRRVAAKVAA